MGALRRLFLTECGQQKSGNSQEGNGSASKVDGDLESPGGGNRAEKQRDDPLQKIGDQKNG